MERRLPIAILLTFLVLTAYQWMVPTPAPQRTATPASPGGTAAPGSTGPSGSAGPGAAPEVTLPSVETVLSDAAERSITVDNGVVQAVFSNRGATLASWQLTRYRDHVGKPIDLVPQDMPAGTPKPFSLK